MVNGVLCLGHKLVIPSSLRKYFLEKVHETHSGIEKCKLKARQSIYWPNINSDIESFVGHCHVCIKYSNNNAKLPMISHEVPSFSWECLSSDIFHYSGKDFLVILGHFTKWLEVLELKSKTASEIISKLMSVFSRFGAPKFLVSDMPYASFELRQFCDEFHIVQKT